MGVEKNASAVGGLSWEFMEGVYFSGLLTGASLGDFFNVLLIFLF